MRHGIGPVWLVVPELACVAGAEQHVANLALLLAEEGRSVSVLSFRPLPTGSPYRGIFAAGGVRLVDLTEASKAGRRARSRPLTASGPRPNVVDRLLDRYASYSPPFERWRAAYHQQAADEPPDVVHVHGFRLDTAPLAAVAVSEGHPVVYTEHATLGEGDDLFSAITDDAWELLSHVELITCVSGHTREVVSAMVPDGRRIEAARHVIRRPGPLGPRDGRSEGPCRVVCLSRLAREKGIDTLLRAAGILARRASPIELLLAGGGPEQERLTALVEEEPEAAAHVRFLGGYRPEQLDDVLRNADVVVLSSHTEGLPVSIVEAFARHLPVVATAVGGTTELVVDGVNGHLVPPRDATAIADVLEGLCRDRPECQRLADGARRTYQEQGWSPDAVLVRTLELYRAARSTAIVDSGAPVAAPARVNSRADRWRIRRPR